MLLRQRETSLPGRVPTRSPRSGRRLARWQGRPAIDHERAVAAAGAGRRVVPGVQVESLGSSCSSQSNGQSALSRGLRDLCRPLPSTCRKTVGTRDKRGESSAATPFPIRRRRCRGRRNRRALSFEEVVINALSENKGFVVRASFSARIVINDSTRYHQCLQRVSEFLSPKLDV